MEDEPKRRGRPPQGKGAKGEPTHIRDYPRQLFTMRPATKERLKAIAGHEGRAAWEVVDDGVNLYFERMKPKDRSAVNQRLKQSAPAPPSDESVT